MVGLDVTLIHQYESRARHEEAIRRAAAYRQARAAGKPRQSLGLIWKLYSRLALSEGERGESGAGTTPQLVS